MKLCKNVFMHALVQKKLDGCRVERLGRHQMLCQNNKNVSILEKLKISLKIKYKKGKNSN